MATTRRENAALVRGFLTDVVAGGDTDAVEFYLSEHVEDHYLVFGDSPGQAPMAELGWRALAATDVDLAIETVVAAGENVAVRATVTGEHRESLMDLAPTGTRFEIACAWFCRIDDGGIVEIWFQPDGLGLLRQLGALPETPSCCPQTKTIENDHP